MENRWKTSVLPSLHQFNLRFFVNFLEQDREINIILNQLQAKYKNIENEARSVLIRT